VVAIANVVISLFIFSPCSKKITKAAPFWGGLKSL